MDIRNFITFNAVVEEEGFTKAARKLNYAQSTVTQHIKEMEMHYKESLFDRIGKKIYLTQFGSKLYERSKTIAKEYEAIIELTAKETPVEVLRIGVYESLLRYRIHHLIQKFKREYPHVDIVIRHGTCFTLREKLRLGQLDLTFQLETDREITDLVVETLCEEKFGMIFEKGRGIEHIHNPNQTIYFTEEGCSYRKLFEKYLDEQGVVRNRIMETSSVDVIKQHVSCGLGYSMIPMVTVGQERENNSLEVIPFDIAEPMYTQIAYHKDKHIFPAMNNFLEMLKRDVEEWV